jgi:hypothetical protein
MLANRTRSCIANSETPQDALFAAAHPGVWVWLSFGLRTAGRRAEAWLQRGLPSS